MWLSVSKGEEGVDGGGDHYLRNSGLFTLLFEGVVLGVVDVAVHY